MADALVAPPDEHLPYTTSMLRPNHRLQVAAVLVSSLLMTSCGRDATADPAADARKKLAEGRPQEAAVVAKAALQATPNAAELRYLLAQALHDQGDFAAAEQELRKSLDLKLSRDRVLPLLAATMMERYMYRRVVDEFAPAASTLGTAESRGRLSITVAEAHAKLGDMTAAQTTLAAALASDVPGEVQLKAKLLGARLLLGQRKVPEARAQLEALTQANPKDGEAWRILGDARLMGTRDLDGALAAYTKAIELQPRNVLSYAAVNAIQLQKGNLPEAKKNIARMKAAAPGQPETRFQEASYLFAAGEFAAARELLQQLVKFFPASPRLLQLAGATEAQLGSFQQAETYYRQAIQATEQPATARMMLAKLYLRTGEGTKALNALQPYMELKPRPPALSLAIGEAYLATGDLKAAESFFRSAAATDPENVNAGIAIALSDFAKGNLAEGTSQLKELTKRDKSDSADLALISALYRAGRFQEALAAASDFAKRKSKEPQPHTLVARIQERLNALAAARQSYNDALAADALYFPAVYGLANLDLAEKKPKDARARLEALLEKAPKNASARLVLADVLLKSGAPKEEILKQMKEAQLSDPSNAQVRVAMVDFLAAKKDLKAALVAAQEAAAVLPNDPAVVDALGGALLLNGELNQALSTFKKLATLQPRSPAPLIRSATVHQIQGDTKAAVASLRAALALDPDQVVAQRNLINIFRKTQKAQEAYAVAADVVKAHPESFLGYAFEADIAIEFKDWPRAIAALKKGIDKPRGGELATRLHGALLKSGNRSEATAFADRWLKANPKDQGFLLYLGGKALEAEDYAAAEGLFVRAVDIAPKNAAALNNAAWAMAKQGKPAAVKMAQAALAISPDFPPFLDTAALAFAATNDFPQAIEHEKRALRASGDAPAYRYNLARIYLRSGDKANGRQELEALLKQNAEPALKDAAKKLLGSL